MPPEPYVTWALMALSVVVSLRGFAAFKAGRQDEYLFVPAELAEGRGWAAMLRSTVSHADGAHLTFNMVTLFCFGPVVEAAFGALGLLGLYVASELGALVFTYEGNKHHPGYRSLGASGAISGVLLAAIVVEPGMQVANLYLPIGIPAPVFALAYLIGSAVGAQRRLGHIGHHAHLGGAVTGFVVAGLMHPDGLAPLMQALRGLAG